MKKINNPMGIIEVTGFRSAKTGKIYLYRYEAEDEWFKETLNTLFANKSGNEIARAIRTDKNFREKLVTVIKTYEEETGL